MEFKLLKLRGKVAYLSCKGKGNIDCRLKLSKHIKQKLFRQTWNFHEHANQIFINPIIEFGNFDNFLPKEFQILQ